MPTDDERRLLEPTSDMAILQLDKIKVWLPKDGPDAIKKVIRLLNAYAGTEE